MQLVVVGNLASWITDMGMEDWESDREEVGMGSGRAKGGVSEEAVVLVSDCC